MSTVHTQPEFSRTPILDLAMWRIAQTVKMPRSEIAKHTSIPKEVSDQLTTISINAPSFWENEVLTAISVDAARYLGSSPKSQLQDVAVHHRYPKNKDHYFYFNTTHNGETLACVHSFVSAKVPHKEPICLVPFTERGSAILNSHHSPIVAVERLQMDKHNISPIGAVVETIRIVRHGKDVLLRKPVLQSVFDLDAFDSLTNNAEFALAKANVSSFLVHKVARSVIRRFENDIEGFLIHKLRQQGISQTTIDLLNRSDTYRGQDKSYVDAFRARQQEIDRLLGKAVDLGFFQLKIETDKKKINNDVLKIQSIKLTCTQPPEDWDPISGAGSPVAQRKPILVSLTDQNPNAGKLVVTYNTSFDEDHTAVS